MNATENPILIHRILQVAPGDSFLLWGRAYRRQDSYRSGDTVLYLCRASRLRLRRDGGVLQNDHLVMQPYQGLRYATVDFEQCSVTEYHADGRFRGLMLLPVFRNDGAPQTVCTPIGVRLVR